MSTSSKTVPAVGQRWRHKESGDAVVLTSRFGNNSGFYTRGRREFRDSQEDQWEFVAASPPILSMNADGPCDSCGGTGKGPPRTYDTDGNFNYRTTDACDNCFGTGRKKYSWSLEQIAEALRPLLTGKR